jgi:hypothetical protein
LALEHRSFSRRLSKRFALVDLFGASRGPDTSVSHLQYRAILARLFRSLRRISLLFCLLIILPLQARVLRVEITSRNDVANGKAFGDAGPYERITGRVYLFLSCSRQSP